MNKELREFLKVSSEILEQCIENKIDDVIEKDPDNFYLETVDYGYYNNGVGFASCGGREDIYDREKARDYAIDEILEETNNVMDNFYYHFADNEKFVTALNNLIRKGIK